MKIGIDARFYGSLGKGLGRYTEKLITYLERLPEDVNSYVIFLRPENFDEYRPANTRFQKVVANYPWYGWQEQLLFPLLIRQHHLDLIHFPHFNVPLFVPVPFVVTIHDLILLHFPTVKASELPPFLYWLKYLAYRVIISSAIRRSRTIITVSQFTASDIVTLYPQAQDKLAITLEAAEPFCYWLSREQEDALLHSWGLISSSHSALSLKPYVLYVGNAYPHKNLHILLRVAPLFPDTTFLCVGKEDYFYRTFQDQVMSRDMHNIHFVGYVDDRTLGVLYRHATTYFFPSLYEGFGLPGLEAMNVGTPVVAARAGSLPEIYGEAAIYFDPNNIESCQLALQESFQTETRNRCRTVGYTCIARFSWRRMAKQTHEIYQHSQDLD